MSLSPETERVPDARSAARLAALLTHCRDTVDLYRDVGSGAPPLEAFPVVDKAIENGLLARQLPGFDTEFVVNAASDRLELLDLHADSPGEPGLIVVTDLFDRAMPMVRYDTGDIGTMGGDTLPERPARGPLRGCPGRRRSGAA